MLTFVVRYKLSDDRAVAVVARPQAIRTTHIRTAEECRQEEHCDASVALPHD